MLRRKITDIEVNAILKKYKIKLDNYSINTHGKLDVLGNVEFVRCTNTGYLPLRFGRVSGTFKCSSTGLTSLKGSPEYVGYDFVCDNNMLTSLKYGPKYVGGSYYCSSNKLENLRGCASEIGRDLNCKMNKLKSLEGSPEKFFGRFNCSHNRLNNFFGAPAVMGGEMYANSNFLKNLRGFNEFKGVLFIDPTASSLNSDIHYKDMRLELRLQAKFGHEFLPNQIIKHHRHLDLILKYQKYYEIWSGLDEDELDEVQFAILIEDIIDGLL